MEDYRILWIKDRVKKGLGIGKDESFIEFLCRNNNEAAKALTSYLNSPIEEDPGALLFYSHLVEVEEEVEMVEGR